MGVFNKVGISLIVLLQEEYRLSILLTTQLCQVLPKTRTLVSSTIPLILIPIGFGVWLFSSYLSQPFWSCNRCSF